MPMPVKPGSGAVPNAYQGLLLTNNPFTADPIIRARSPDPRTNGKIFADGCRKEVINRFEKLLIRAGDFDNRARLALLWSEGDKESGRGTGKTALLRHFQHRLNCDWGATEFKHFSAAAIYVCFPTQVDRLYSEQLAWSALLDAQDSRLVRSAAATLRLEEMEKRWPDKAKAFKKLLEEKEAANQDPVDVLFDEGVLNESGISMVELHGAVVERLTDAEVTVAVADALARDALGDHLRSLRRDHELRPYYVQRDTKGLTLAKEILFNDLVKFLRVASFAGAYLFIDDIENLTDQMANKETIEFAKELALCLVRPGFASGELRFFSGVITTHQQAATKLARGWGEAGLQGVARLDPSADTSIKVPLPTVDGALEMLAAYITFHRLLGHESVDPLHPFTDAAARKLVAGVKPSLHPRSFLQKAHFAVKRAVDTGATTIDVPDVDQLFADTGIAVAVAAGTGEPDQFDVF